jgi:hypothetical protein
MRKFILIFIPILLLLLTGCSGSREFRLDAATDDIGTQNVTLVYYADGAYHQEEVSAIDGNFTYIGTTSEPTFVEIYTSSTSLLGEFIVEGGDHIKARFSRLNPENVTIKGNKDSEMLADFMKENRKIFDKNDVNAINRAIEAFVRENPKRFLSTVLLTRYFTLEGYEKLAAELFALIPSKYRTEGYTTGFQQLLSEALASDTLAITSIRSFSLDDTAYIYTPAGAKMNLLMLLDGESRGEDSIKQMLSVLRNGTPSTANLRITDFGCDRDTMQWHSSLRDLPTDYPADIKRLWLVGSVATEGIAASTPTTIPYFILTDSVGTLLYRSSSATATRAAFGRLRKKLKF